MAYDGTLKFDTSLDASGMQKGANNLKSIVEGLGIFEILKKGVQMVADSVQAAMGRIDTMDQFSRVMTTMTGSTDKANAALKKTNSIVTGTAYGLDTAAKGVQAFVASGMEVSNATDTMGAWADAVSFYTKGTNVELETVSMALQKMGTKGNVTMEHLQMLLEAGIPAIQIYASAVGVSTEEVTAAMSRGELKTSDFIGVMNQAFQTGTTGFPSVAGAAKQAGASWAGSISNMNAATARGTASILTAFDKMFNVKGNMVAFGKGIENVMKLVAQNMDKVVIATAAVVAGFITLKVMKTVATSMQAINTVVTVANTALLGYSKGMFTASEAASVLTVKQAIAGAMTMVLSGEMTVGAAVTLVFKTAVQALNKAFLANPIVLVITLIVALIGVIINAANRTNEAAESAKKEAESLAAANDELTQSAADSAAEYEKSMATINRTAQEAGTLTARYQTLRDQTERTAAEQQEMDAALARLIQQYPELTRFLDENGTALNGNAAEWQKVTSASFEYDETIAMIERATEVTDEATKAQINLDASTRTVSRNLETLANNEKIIAKKSKQADDAYAKLTNGMYSNGTEADALQKKYNSLIGEIDDLELENKGLTAANKTLEDGMDGLSETAKRLAEEQKSQAELAKSQADATATLYSAQVNAYSSVAEASTKMTAKEVADMRTLIDAGAKFEQATIDKFIAIETAQASAAVKEADYVQAVKDGQVEIDMAYAASVEERRLKGEELNAQDQAILDRWNEINQAAIDNYKSQQQEIIDATRGRNEAINLSDQDSAKTRLAQQESNNKVTSAYVDNYNSIMQKIPDSQKQYLQEMTIEDARFLNDMVSSWDKGGKEQWDQYVAGIESGTAKANELIQPTVSGVATEMDGAMQTQLTQSGTATGQQYAQDVADGAANGNYSGITTGIVSAITSGLSGVQAAVNTVGLSIEAGFMRASTQATQVITTMMSSVSARISAGRGSVVSAVTSIASAIKTTLDTLKAQVSISINATMTAIQYALGQTGGINAAAAGIVTSIIARINAMPEQAISVVRQMFAGMRNAMDEYAPSLYNKAQTIAKEIIRILKSAFDVHSPSRVTFGIFKNVMQGAVNAMDMGADKLYALTGNMAGGVLSQLSNIPEDVMVDMTARMHNAIASTKRDIARGMSVFVNAPNPNNTTTTNTTTNAPVIQFNEPVNSPDVVARRVSQVMRSGLAGGKR